MLLSSDAHADTLVGEHKYAAAILEEGGWAFTIQCCDCGAQTAIATYNKPEERQKAAEQAAYTWNLGKVIYPGPGE